MQSRGATQPTQRYSSTIPNPVSTHIKVQRMHFKGGCIGRDPDNARGTFVIQAMYHIAEVQMQTGQQG